MFIVEGVDDVLMYFYLKNSYIVLTATQLKKTVKEHISTCVYKFLRSSEKKKETKSVKILNSAKRSDIAEHLVNNKSCARIFNLDRFNIIKSCGNMLNLINLLIFDLF